ncbi:BREX system ATP-binding domain-containing protein [Actinoplanes sp. NPDC026670]|uniref:BREX system ATP-binding domain-containing protein n=1 Tax=Actinoplanes sp. NPDC026670 TaxID=3154700 RepID=UPI0033E3C0D5
MTGTTDVIARRAIEALRAGVPSRDAVAALGSGQSAIEDRFETMCSSAAAGSPASMLIGGGFGAGKSHLLEHLARLALNNGWTVSRVVISKETPLHDPAKVFRAAADSALRDGQARPAIIEAAAGLDLDGRSYAELLRWASSSGSELNERFPATLTLYAHLRERDPAFAETILRFWSGDTIAIPELRKRMREIGEQRPVFSPVAAAELARQRLRFAARLLAAAGAPGWLVLFDEVELIGRYSLLQRAKSYAELARWMRGEQGRGTPTAAVLAMTDDFEAAVITGRNDRHVVPERLRTKGTPDAAELAVSAELGMRIIDREMHLLTPPDDTELKQVYARLRDLHGQAFGWHPPDVTGLERLGANRMRQYVRAWINEWDLVRLDPGYRPETEAVTVTSDYREDPDLERTEPE